jgi:hypothetical protein
MLSRELAQRGVTIISGLARGIDAAAHRGALEGGGKNCRGDGNGLDQFYPRDHSKLALEILQKAARWSLSFPRHSAGLREFSVSQSRHQRIEFGCVVWKLQRIPAR